MTRPTDDTLRRGAALYRSGRFFDAHEVWEDAWRQLARGSAAAALYQGLIQWAAACLKLESGQHRGAERLAERAVASLRRAAGAAGERLDPGALADAIEAFMSASPASPDGRPGVVLR